MAPRLELFPFRHRDSRAGKWVRARYLAVLHELKARYAASGCKRVALSLALFDMLVDLLSGGKH